MEGWFILTVEHYAVTTNYAHKGPTLAHTAPLCPLWADAILDLLG